MTIGLTCPSTQTDTLGVFFSWLNGTKSEKDLPAAGFNYVDVRDAALGHVLALTVPEAGGERFITGNGPTSGNDYVLVCLILFDFDLSKRLIASRPSTRPSPG